LITEYRGTCPRCNYLRALYFKELNINQIHIECKKCGLEESQTLPKIDYEAQKALFHKARKRISTFESSLTKPPAGERAGALILAIHQQLTYLLRMLQSQRMMDNDLGDILDQSLKDYDITQTFWMAAAAQDSAPVIDLDNQYGGFVHWIEAGLRSLGATDEKVLKEIGGYRKEVDEFEVEHINAGGKPFTYSRARTKG
jgi:hypothetical protein